MNNKIYHILESIATVGWLIMDFSWMTGHLTFAVVFSCISLICAFCAIFAYNGSRLSERILLIASLMWVVMNSAWMAGEFQISIMTSISKISFIFAIIFVIVAFFLSKKEDKDIDFKRLKM